VAERWHRYEKARNMRDAVASPDGLSLTREDLALLLAKTSRTFALAIPLLEEPLARHVGVAYLLFRIADELEDAPLWRRDRRARALASVALWLDGQRDQEAMAWKKLVEESRPTTNEGCLELLVRADEVLGAASERAVIDHARRTAVGMASFVARQDERGGLVLDDVKDLRNYCYVVAGIVGELLTHLFALTDPNVASVRDRLDADTRAFGEGLQLVNILKDAPSDSREGRVYLPRDVPRSTIVDLARSDLACAERYVRTLSDAKAPFGVIAFCDLPVRLAVATLDALDRGVPKLPREEVMRIFKDVTSA
jgi:farnesyl-diphosphate farnesyltransferase